MSLFLCFKSITQQDAHYNGKLEHLSGGISKHVASPFNPTCLLRLSCTECFRTTIVERGCVIDGPIHNKVCSQIQCTKIFYLVL